MQDPTVVREFFREELRSLLKMVTEFPRDQLEQHIPEFGSVMALPSFRQTRILEGNPPREVLPFEHLYDEGEFYLSDRFLSAWDKYCQERQISPIEQRAMAHLFMLHEMLHTKQSLSSYKFHDTDFAPNVLHVVDYMADALSIITCYNLYTYHKTTGWIEATPQQRVANLIQAAIRGMEIFTSIYGRFPMERCRQQYFWRYLTWHFQYARMRRWRGSLERLIESLRSLPLFDIEGIPQKFNRDEFSKDHLKLFMTLVEPFKPVKIYRYRGDNVSFASNIFDGITNGNCELSSRSFNEVLEQYDELLGEVEGTPPETVEARRIYRETYRTLSGFLNALSRLEQAHDALGDAKEHPETAEQVRGHQERFDQIYRETESRMFEVSDVLHEIKNVFRSRSVIDACTLFVEWHHKVVDHEERAGCGPDSKGQQLLRGILSAMDNELQTHETRRTT